MEAYKRFDAMELKFTQCKISDELYEMGTKGYTDVVLRQKLSYIQFHKFDIPQWQSSRMRQVMKQYINVFLRKMAENFHIMAFHPFIIVENMQFIDETDKSKFVCNVPISLKIEDLVFEVAVDGHMKNIYKIYLKNENFSEKPLKIYYVSSNQRNGLSDIDPYACDSDMGSIYKDYKEIESRKKNVDTHIDEFLKRNFIIEPHNYGNAQQAKDKSDQLQYVEYINTKYGPEHGYTNEVTHASIKDNSENKTSIVPEGYTLCKFQTHLDVNLLNYHQLDVDYKKSVDMTLKMRPVGETTTKYQNTESQEHNNLQLSLALDELIFDVLSGMKDVLQLCYKDYLLDNILYLPHRSLIDKNTIMFLFENNIVDEKWRNEALLKLLGIEDFDGPNKKQKIQAEDVLSGSQTKISRETATTH